MDIPVFFNSDALISGDLLFTSDLHINCEILGNVESEKKIVIGPEGFFKGTLKAKELVVFGKLEGDITIFGPTVLHSGSAISGTLSTQVIEIIDCASLDISVKIIDIEPASKAMEFPAQQLNEIELEWQPFSYKTNSVKPEVRAENSASARQVLILPEIVEKYAESIEPAKNFLFTHFSETNLTHDSMYTKSFFEVANDLNAANLCGSEKRCLRTESISGK